MLTEIEPVTLYRFLRIYFLLLRIEVSVSHPENICDPLINILETACCHQQACVLQNLDCLQLLCSIVQSVSQMTGVY